jgi:hypothetical protein
LGPGIDLPGPGATSIAVQWFLVASAGEIGGGLDTGPAVRLRIPVVDQIALDARLGGYFEWSGDTGHAPWGASAGAGVVFADNVALRVEGEITSAAEDQGLAPGAALTLGIDHPPPALLAVEAVLGLLFLAVVAPAVEDSIP